MQNRQGPGVWSKSNRWEKERYGLKNQVITKLTVWFLKARAISPFFVYNDYEFDKFFGRYVDNDNLYGFETHWIKPLDTLISDL
mgnify:CR=1 FL=1